MGALLRCHTLYDGLYALESIVVNVYILNCLAHARYHGSQVLKISHFLDLLYLAKEVVEVELVLLYFLLKLACLLLVELLLGALNKRYDVAHAKDAVCHTVGMEYVDGLHLLSGTNKLDRLSDNSPDTQCRTTTRVTVKFGKYHTVEVKPVIKLLGSVDSILSSHGVNDKESLVGVQSLLERCYLVHHLLVNGKSSGRIDDDGIISLGLCLTDGVVGYSHDILAVGLGIYRNTNLSTYHLQLLDGCRTIDVAGYEQGVLMLLELQLVGKLSAEGSLTRALQSAHEDYGWS